MTDGIACTYAALILNDAGIATSSDNIEKLCSAAGLEVRNTMPILFSRYLEKNGIESLMTKAAGAGPAQAPPSAPAGATAAAPAAEESSKGKKKEEPEEEDDDLGFGGLF